MRTTTWWRRCGSEPGSGAEAQLWAWAALGGSWKRGSGATGVARGLWLPPCPLDSVGGASRPPSAAGWALATRTIRRHHSSPRGAWGLGPHHLDGLSRSRCIYSWEIWLTLQWPRCVPGGAASGRYRGPGLSAPSPARGLRPVRVTNQASRVSHVRVCASGPSVGTTTPGKQEVGVC